MGGGLSRDARRRRADPSFARGHTRSVRGFLGKWAAGVPLAPFALVFLFDPAFLGRAAWLWGSAAITERGPPTISVLLDPHPLLLGVALARGVAERQRAFDLGELGVGQIDIRRGRAFLEVGGGASAGNGHDMRRLGERPRDGQGR